MTELEWSRLNAGVFWMRVGNRERYGALLREMKAEGIGVAQFNADVQQAADNGLVVTEEREPA